jgi:hypothetical protein
MRRSRRDGKRDSIYPRYSGVVRPSWPIDASRPGGLDQQASIVLDGRAASSAAARRHVRNNEIT